jgi:hypothetical protein
MRTNIQSVDNKTFGFILGVVFGVASRLACETVGVFFAMFIGKLPIIGMNLMIWFSRSAVLRGAASAATSC